MNLKELNQLSAEEAAKQFQQCCTSTSWGLRMVASRPFESRQMLLTMADINWQNLTEQDYLEAFEGHPKIGDVSSLRAKYAHTKALAGAEQSGVNQASEATLLALAEGNRAYEEKFGFIFIVCATGKSAGEMLELLEARLPNSRQDELQNAAEEQLKITRIRLEKLAENADTTSDQLINNTNQQEKEIL